MSNVFYELAKDKLGTEKPKQINTVDYNSPEFTDAIRKLWGEGYSCEQIGRALGVKRHSIGSWLSRNGLKRKGSKGKALGIKA